MIYQSENKARVLIFSASDHLSQLRLFFSNFILSSKPVKFKRRPPTESEITSKINDTVDRWIHLSNALLQNGSIKEKLRVLFFKYVAQNVEVFFFSLNDVYFISLKTV